MNAKIAEALLPLAVPIDDLTSAPGNPRRGDVGAIAGSLERFGQRKPVTVHKASGVISAGNHTWMAAKGLGWSHIAAVFVDEPKADAVAWGIRDNLTSDLAFNDEELLAGLLVSLKEEGHLLDAGYSEGMLQELLGRVTSTLDYQDGQTDPDDLPEAPAESYIQRGELWLLGRHRLLCGDATESKDIAFLMDDQPANLLLTDPPYGIGIVRHIGDSIGGDSILFKNEEGKTQREIPGRIRSHHAYPWGGVESRGRVGYNGIVKDRIVKAGVYYPVAGDDKPFDPTHLLGLAPKIILFGANYFASRLPDGKAWIVWEKGAVGDFSPCELAWTSWAGRIHRYDYHWAGVIREGLRKEELAKRIHPTQKPVGLFAQIITDFSNAGDIVLDPYLGSGTTIVAAERTGRRCFGMEIEPRYCQVSIERWQNYTNKIAIKGASHAR